MAEEEIVQNLIFQLGQSQEERMPKELGTHFADADERTPEALLALAKKLASSVAFYRDSVSAPAGNWSPFFPAPSEIPGLLEREDGETPPHLALFLAFLELYKKPQELLNGATGRHLDFHYEEVLRLQKKGAVPDRAHLRVELKKNTAPLLISPEHRFSGGKDKKGVELVYAPVRSTVINTSEVASLRSLFVDPAGKGTVRAAPVANSSDGVGGKLEEALPNWSAFGHEALPEGEVGFALASPVLRMKEGVRKVTAALTLNGADPARLTESAMAGAFEAFITGEKSWLGPYSLSPALQGNELRLDFTVPESEEGVVDYNAAIHGYAYVAEAPVVQLLLKPGKSVGYNDFKNVTVQKAAVSVEVSEITSLNVENDAGTLDPKKAFLPFGPQPTRGSQFRIGYPEALSKKLSELKINAQWKDAPAQFSTHYSGYGSAVGNGTFTAAVSFKDAGSWEVAGSGVPLFESENASSERTFAFTLGSASVSPAASEGKVVYALSSARSEWAMGAARKRVLQSPVFRRFLTALPEGREGFINFSLEENFRHAAYRKKYVENVLTYSKTGKKDETPVILNEPYTPAIQRISLAYKAHSDTVNLASASVDEFSNPDVHFFQIAYFGQMREHAYQRAQFPFLSDKQVSLLPAYDHRGALLIGLSRLQAGESVSLLFQAAEGSADPDLAPEAIDWSVLCDNYWKPLSRREVVLDTTGQLLTSGTIQFVIPREATLSNTILPPGLIWIKGAVAERVAAVSQLIEVAANAVEVRFVDRGNDPDHLQTPLAPGKIAKLKNGLAGVKGVKQPYSSFGGRPVETGDAFHTRASERLRHKNRAITGWDYERIVLEAFPKVRQVKCIPHAQEGNWLAPGNMLVVVIPDLRNQNAIDPLRPKVDAGTIGRITGHLKARAGMQVNVKVKNPAYQPVRLDFKVKFHIGHEFNFYSGELNRELIRFLSPWAFDATRELSFGGKVYKSVLLDFVEELNYVDYVTDFKMLRTDGPFQGIDLNEAKPESPDAILVSAESHLIQEVE